MRTALLLGGIVSLVSVWLDVWPFYVQRQVKGMMFRIALGIAMIAAFFILE